MRKSWDGDGEETRDVHRQYSSARKLSVRVQIRPPNETADRSQSIKAVSQFLRNKLIYYVAGTINQAPSPKPHAGNSSQVLANIPLAAPCFFSPGLPLFGGMSNIKLYTDPKIILYSENRNSPKPSVAACCSPPARLANK